MSALLLRGAPVAREIRERARAAADLLGDRASIEPTLATLRVGADPSAGAYRASIERLVAKAGVRHLAVDLDATAEPARLVEVIHALNADPAVHGVVLLMPLPPHLPIDLALEHLSPLKDVDGITPLNAGRLHLGLPALRPSTPQGGLELLDHYGIAIAGKRAVVVGRSNVVGKPMAALLTARDATVVLCHRRTADLPALLGEADLVVMAAGCPGLLQGSMLRDGAVVVDFGINVVGDAIVGDVDAASVAARAAAYTPVPGGTGPVTTMVLARNTVAAAFASLAAAAELEASQVELMQGLVAPV